MKKNFQNIPPKNINNDTDSISYILYNLKSTKSVYSELPKFQTNKIYKFTNSEILNDYKDGKDFVTSRLFSLNKVNQVYENTAFSETGKQIFKNVKPETISINTNIKEKSSEPYISTTSFILAIILINLVLLALVKHFYNSYIKSLFSASLSASFANTFFRQNEVNPQKANTILNIFYFFSFSIFIFQIFKVYNFLQEINMFILFLSIFLIAIFMQILHKFANIILGYVFETTTIAKEYNFSINIFNQIFGLIALILSIGISFTNPAISNFLIIVGIIFISILHVMRSLRLFQIFIKNNVFLFYFFLYICTLEITPLLLLYSNVTN